MEVADKNSNTSLDFIVPICMKLAVTGFFASEINNLENTNEVSFTL